MARGPSAPPAPSGPGPGVPRRSAGLGRQAHAWAVTSSGAGREPRSALTGRILPSPQSTPALPAALLWVERTRARAESPMETPVSTRPWGLWVFPGRCHLRGRCKGPRPGPLVGGAGLLNHTFWGPEVSLMFLIYGDVIGTSLPIYEKRLNNTPTSHGRLITWITPGGA